MITTITGKNTFLLGQKLSEMSADFIAKNSDLAVERLDGQDADTPHMVEAMESLPFLTSKKLVILTEPSTQKDFAQSFQIIIDRVPDTTDVIIVEPHLDKRSVYAKDLKKLTDYQEFNHQEGEDLARWLVDVAKNQDGNISLGDARYLTRRVSINQQQLYSELQKLLAYNPQISRESIDLMTEEAPQSTVFNLLDAAFAGNVKRALGLYDEQRRQRVEPQLILGMIAWQLHILALVATGKDLSDNELAKQAGISPFVVGKSRDILQRIGGARVKQLVGMALKLDIDLKSKPIDADDALQNFIVNLTD